MTFSKILSFLFCSSILVVDIIATSPYTCKGNIYNITRDNNEEAANKFQRWLHWRQNQPDRCVSGKVESSTQYGFGLGASILESIKKMLSTIETGDKVSLILINLGNPKPIGHRSHLSASLNMVMVRRSIS